MSLVINKSRVRCFALLLFVAVNVCLTLNIAAQPQPKRIIDRFFKTWLINKDAIRSMGFFDPKAFNNRYMCWDCNGNISIRGRHSSAKLKNEIRKFLFHASRLKMYLVLPQDYLKDFIDREKENLINKPENDKYFLYRVAVIQKFLEPSRETTFLRKHYDLRKARICLIGLSFKGEPDDLEGVMFFLWVPVKNSWKIVSLGFVNP